MFEFLKKPKFRTALFIFSSLTVFFILLIFYLILANNNSSIKFQERTDSNYFDDNNYRSGKLVQKVPDLGDILTGPIISSIDPSLGEIDSQVAIVYFADFECDFCRKQEKILQEIFGKYSDQVKLIWKDYPESNQESISYKSAVAARCAQEQDGFWEYHDQLFLAPNLSDNIFLEIAEKLDLSKRKFEKCLEGTGAPKLVDDNIEEANALDINGVPFIYVNSQEIMGQISYEDLEKIVEIEINN